MTETKQLQLTLPLVFTADGASATKCKYELGSGYDAQFIELAMFEGVYCYFDAAVTAAQSIELQHSCFGNPLVEGLSRACDPTIDHASWSQCVATTTSISYVAAAADSEALARSGSDSSADVYDFSEILRQKIRLQEAKHFRAILRLVRDFD
jgi:hypothetical protein